MSLLFDLPLDATSWFLAGPRMMVLAYLDPGTGSYVLQILLATLFGGLFTLKQSWSELKLWFFARSGEPLNSNEPMPTRPATGVRPNELARPSVHGHTTAKIR